MVRSERSEAETQAFWNEWLDAQTLSARFHWRDAVYVLTIAGPISRIASKRDAAVKLLLESCRKLDFSS